MQVKHLQGCLKYQENEMLEIAINEEEPAGLFDLCEADDSKTPVSDSPAHNEDIMAAYLDEIKNTSPLPREREHTLAKTLHEAESLKDVYAGEWLLHFAELVDWRKIKQNQIHHFKQPDPALQNLIQMLQAIHDRTGSANHRNKPHKVKLLVHAFARDANIIKFYQSGAVTRLKPFLRSNKTCKAGSLLRILRQFIRHDKISKETKEALVQSNLRFVVSIAKSYCNRGRPLSDLIQEGNTGLIRSIEKFDYRRGYRLSTYAGWWIRQSIIRALENKALTIRVPVYMNGKARKIKKLMDDDCLFPEAAVDASGHDKIAYRAFQAMQEPISLDASVNSSRCLHESIADSQATSHVDREVASFYFAKETEGILKCLSAREKSVIRLHFGLGNDSTHTLEEIGSRYGISRERVRQIESAALRKMRLSSKARQLRPFLEEMAGN